MTKKNINIGAADRFLSNKKNKDNEHNAYSAQGKQSDEDEQKEPNPTSKKGQKLPRINMAFTHENLDYLQRISKLEETSITQYVNDIIYNDLKNRMEDLEKAEKVFEEAKKMLNKS